MPCHRITPCRFTTVFAVIKAGCRARYKTQGFTHMSSQAMMVRHTVKHIRHKQAPTLSEEMKKKAVAATNGQWFDQTTEPEEVIND